jgi:hypothetical protein
MQIATMKTLIVLLSLSSLFFLQSGCCDTSEDERYHQLIQGDWVTKDLDTKTSRSGMFVFPLGPPQAVCSFQDSLCSMMYPFDDFSSFSIRNKILYVRKSDKHHQNKKTMHRRYTIISLRKNQLRLAAIDGSDTLTFQKIREKNRITPEMISFHSSVCFGTCPSISLDIDSNKNIRYFGGHSSERKGSYKGTISDKNYKVLVRLIHQLPLTTLKEDYYKHSSDGQSCTIAIRYNGKWKTCSVYGYDKEPIELRLLFQRFFLIVLKAQLSPYSVNHDSFKAYRVSNPPEEKTVQFLPPVVLEEP